MGIGGILKISCICTFNICKLSYAITIYISPFKAVQKAMSDLDLQGHTNTLCGDLSGGTKRKVCAAISMLGSPHLILMDEPTR